MKAITHYSEQAIHYQTLYDSVDSAQIHAEWESILNTTSAGTALDVGAGSGRDARWLAMKGWRVIAVEPANALRELAEKNSHDLITWCSSSLPKLAGLPTPCELYDLILVSAVWMHIPPEEREAALIRLKSLLAKDGQMIISLRFGPNDPNRPMFEVSEEELVTLGEALDLRVESLTLTPTSDTLKRNDVSWKTVRLRHAVPV